MSYTATMKNRIFHNSGHDHAWPTITSEEPFVSLDITKGTTRRRVRLIDTPVFLIGTDQNCDLTLGDPQFPEVYAYLFIRHGHVSVRRLGDGPDLSVSGQIVEGAPLSNGDLIRTGPFEFRINVQRRPTVREAAVIRLPSSRTIDRHVLMSALDLCE